MSGRAAIVIFGAAVRPDGSPSGALRGRVEAAVALGRELADPLYVPTGGQGRYGAPEAEVMRALLLGMGVRGEAILVEGTGRNTVRSAVACWRMLRGRAALAAPTLTPSLSRQREREQGGGFQGEVLVATSGYHMVRCVLLLRLLGLRARAGRAACGAASARWVKRWFWRLREVPAVPVDVIQVVIWRWWGSLSR